MPRRSTGCQRCRQRRVKCGEERPGCRRCADYGADCPGYTSARPRGLQFIYHQDLGSAAAAANTVPNDSTVVKAERESDDGHFLGSRDGKNPQSQSVRTLQQHQHQHIAQVSSGQMHRAQLLSTFLDLYLPKYWDNNLSSNFAYFTSLPGLNLSTPLLRISIDALCLAEVGSLNNDVSYLFQARACYTNALPMLANELARPPERQLRKDYVLAAITVLTVCELFDCISQSAQGGRGWISHVNGGQMYLQAAGPAAVSSPVGLLLLHATRSNALAMGLVRRKASVFAEKQWLNFTSSMAVSDHWTAFFDIALQVPGLLEMADKLHEATEARIDVADLCLHICRLRSKLDGWLEAFVASDRHRYDIVDIREMAAFSSVYSGNLFDTAYSFPSSQSCQLQTLYWSCVMLLDFTFLDVYRKYIPHIDCLTMTMFTSRTEQEIEHDMYLIACDFCKSVPYVCEPGIAAIGRIGPFLLRIAKSYFQHAGHDVELQWCQEVASALEAMKARNSGAMPSAQSGHRTATDTVSKVESEEQGSGNEHVHTHVVIPDPAINTYPEPEFWRARGIAPPMLSSAFVSTMASRPRRFESGAQQRIGAPSAPVQKHMALPTDRVTA